MLRTGKLFQNAFVGVIVAVAVIYMATSYMNYLKQGASTEAFVLPTEVRIGIWVIVGVILLISLFPKGKKFH